jgi:hypothetical protein
MRAVRLFLWGLVMLPLQAVAADAGARLTCEQIYAVAQSSLGYRDQGHALAQVLAALEGGDIRRRFDDTQVEALRSAVSAAYLGTATPEEIALDCLRRRGRD